MASAASEAVEDVSVELLLDAEAETVIGHPIAYPGGAPAVTTSIVTLALRP